MTNPSPVLSVYSGDVRLGDDGPFLYPATLSAGCLRIGLRLPRAVTGVAASQISAWIGLRDGASRPPSDSTVATGENFTEIELRFEVEGENPATSLHLSGPSVGGEWAIVLRPG